MLRTRALVGGVLAAVTLAGCGSSEPFPYGSASGSRIEVAAPTVLQALATTNAQETARVAMTVEMTGIPGGEEFGMTADGVMSLDGTLLDIESHVEAAGESLEMSMRVVEGVLYARISGVPNAPDGWMKMNPADLGVGAADTLGTTSDPGQFLDYLYGVADSVQEVGREEVRGVDTTHYFASIDLTRAAESESVPPEVRDELLQQIASLGLALPPIPADVWVDDEGRVRKFEMLMDFGDFLGGFGGEGAPAMNIIVTVELYDFGVDADVEPPPADEIIPFDQALLGAGASA
jgi:hypothetical protein